MHDTHAPTPTARRLTLAVLAALLLVAGWATVGHDSPAAAAGVGGRVAYASDVDGDFEIYAIEPTGGGATKLTSNPARDTQPVWSRDGRIAFMSDRDGDADIYLMKADGTGVTQITNSPGVDSRPTWSPDGTRLAFRSDRSGGQQVYVVRLDQAGYPATKITSGTSNNTEPSWGAGDRIAFTSNRDGDREIFTMDPDGTDVAKVTSNGADDGNARWVSASRLVLQSKVGGDFEIVEIDADGTDRVARTNTAADEMQPALSPTGAQLAYTTDAPGGDRSLVLAKADGTGATTRLSRCDPRVPGLGAQDPGLPPAPEDRGRDRPADGHDRDGALPHSHRDRRCPCGAPVRCVHALVVRPGWTDEGPRADGALPPAGHRLRADDLRPEGDGGGRGRLHARRRGQDPHPPGDAHGDPRLGLRRR